MQWSPQQDAALEAFRKWFPDHRKGGVFRLFGFAGTGKTTLALELAGTVGGNVLFAAFTGKAASVMKSKGCVGATTIHSLIYTTKSNSKLRLLQLEGLFKEETDENARDKLRQQIALETKNVSRPNFQLNWDSAVRHADLLVIDEVSMVDERIGADLISFKKPILVLGDPAQLPPVRGTGYFMDPNPEIMLTEVHRTALDNPVLAMATRIREGHELAMGQYGDSAIVSRAAAAGRGLEFDQTIVGRNMTRVTINTRVRTRLGYAAIDKFPVPGDKIICLRNNHELGLLNGVMYKVQESVADEVSVNMKIALEAEDTPLEVEAHPGPFLGQEVPLWERTNSTNEFTYGYAITCHKAQGSEWKNVLIFDESAAFRADRAKWLYTAITRASGKVLVVR